MVDCPHRMNYNKLIMKKNARRVYLGGAPQPHTPGRADSLEPAAVRIHIIIIMIIVVIKA